MTSNELCEKYLEYLKGILHFIDKPIKMDDLSYIPNKSEANNDLCMVFDDNYKILDMIRLKSDAPVDFDKDDFFRATHYSDDCRFIRIKGETYDLYNPHDIARIPIPPIDFSFIEEEDIPEWFKESVGYIKISKFYPDPDSDPREKDFAMFWNGDGYFEKAIEMLTNQGREATLKEFTDLAVEFAKNNGLNYCREAIEEFIDTWIDIIEEDLMNDDQMLSDDDSFEWLEDVSEEDFQVVGGVEVDDFDYDEDEEDTRGNELGSMLEHRIISCFEPTILLPMSYIAVNLSISEKSLYNLERVVAQLVANNEDEYGIYLSEQLSKMCPTRSCHETWSNEDSIGYGNTLKNWAVNTREYNWFKENFPDEAPKTKGAYTTAKHKMTKRYLELKQLAESNGYQLNDNT